MQAQLDDAAAIEKLLREQLLAQATEAEAEREDLEAQLQALRRSAGAVSQEAIVKSRQDMDKLRDKLAAETHAREDVEDRCLKPDPNPTPQALSPQPSALS